ncbi:MAG: hypothetical protein IKY17_05630 [Oscillospiraceae bacterium]|nr:hypothetical protein [Oscillospiraceae bacterium]
MSRHDFRRKSSFRKDEELNEQEPAELFVPAMTPEEREMRKYEARRKITRMVIIRMVMCALLLWTAFWFAMPVAMRILLVGVVVMIMGTMVPVLMTLKTTLKYEDE